MTTNQFLFRFLAFSAIIAVVLYFLGQVELIQPAMKFAWICFAIFFALTLGTYIMAAKSMAGRFQNFMNVFFAGIILKFFVVGTLVLIYNSVKPEEANSSIAFVIPFALIYFSYLAFETVYLVKLSKQQEQ